MIEPKFIYYTEEAFNTKYGRELLLYYKDVDKQKVKSVQSIKLPKDNPIQEKGSYVIVTTLKVPKIVYSGRSSDYIAPSIVNGCASACAYCYAWRHKLDNYGYTIYTNIYEILQMVDNHSRSLMFGYDTRPQIGMQTDPLYITYDIGCNSDVSIDYDRIPNYKNILLNFINFKYAKATFATKTVNRNLLDIPNINRKIRIRFSLLPEFISKKVDINTSPVVERIKAINDFYKAGYEVHVNFSPVIVYPNWVNDYVEMMQLLDSELLPEVKDQLKCEIIFLTHNYNLHNMNMQYNFRSEEYLWQPKYQEHKKSGYGGDNIRYKLSLKEKYIEKFISLIEENIPYCKVRYVF